MGPSTSRGLWVDGMRECEGTSASSPGSGTPLLPGGGAWRFKEEDSFCFGVALCHLQSACCILTLCSLCGKPCPLPEDSVSHLTSFSQHWPSQAHSMDEKTEARRPSCPRSTCEDTAESKHFSPLLPLLGTSCLLGRQGFKSWPRVLCETRWFPCWTESWWKLCERCL